MEALDVSSIEPIEGSLLSLEGIDDSLVDHDVAALANVQTILAPLASPLHQNQLQIIHDQ